MNFAADAIELSIGLLLGMVACLEIGYRVGFQQLSRDTGTNKGTGAIEAAIFGLLGLLLGFAFSGATSRLEYRRSLIVQEANAIGTAYLRVDLAPAAEQPALRRLFGEYLQARLRVYENVQDPAIYASHMDRATSLQREIWSHALTAGAADATGNTARVLLPAINEMIDVTAARAAALTTRLPSLIRILLIAVALLSALMAGYAMAERKARSWLHMFLYAGAVSITFYTVLDLDNPRSGLIRLDATEAILQQLHNSIR
jgi:hypothetical protein